jgi:Tfp pilus assembly protein PilO
MAANTPVSNKRQMINKANARIVVFVSVAAFILVFSLVATKTLVSQAAYQNRVISKKRAAVNQLKTDITATAALKTSYKAFVDTPQNVLGGNPLGAGAQDGNNAKIVLDALPSTYDFPGLTTSLEALVAQVGQGVKIDSISGTDDEVAQSANQTSVSPQPVPIPFTIVVEGDYGAIQNVVKVFESSIRPIKLQKLNITGTKDKLTLNISAQTFYQPSKSLNIKKQVVK